MGLQTNNTKEIDVVGALKKVLAEKRLLLKFCIVFSIIGVIVALSIPRVYTSTVVLAPENSTGSSALSKFGALGSMIGINRMIICEEDFEKFFNSKDETVEYFKGNEKILEYFNLKKSVCFGDGSNDVQMIKEATIGIAMGNACQSAKDVSDFITLSCNQDGITYACEKLGFLKEEDYPFYY